MMNTENIYSNKDIEANNETEVTELKSILKKYDIDNKDEKNIEIMIFKIYSTVFIFIFMVPIIVLDLYFGFTDNSCINKKSNEIVFTTNMFLLVSGFFGPVNLLILFCNICLLSKDTEQIYNPNVLFLKIIEVFGIILYLIWNIIFAIVFWGTIYKKEVCDNTVSIYIFVSLILKFIGNLFRLHKNCKKKD